MSKTKHIVVITTSFPEGEPGSEAAGSFVSDFVQELSRHAKVTVIAPALRRMVAEERGSLTVRPFIVPRLPLSLLSPINPLHWASILKVILSGKRILTQVVMETKIDHIVALWALPSGYWAREASKKFDIPYSTWALGSDIWSLGRIPFVRTVLKGVLKDSKTCFADGYLLKGDVERISGRKCEFLSSMRSLPVQSKKELAPTPPYRLAFLGRWHKNKGIDLLLESLVLLNDDDWTKIEEVRICGGGPLAKRIQSTCEELKKKGRSVTFGGYLNKAEATDLLAWADYLLIPSRVESIPVVFSDAIQLGCPVIATPVGDLPKLIEEHEVGVVSTKVSALSFTDALRCALSSSPSEYSSGLEICCEKFSLQSTVEHLLHTIGFPVSPEWRRAL